MEEGEVFTSVKIHVCFIIYHFFNAVHVSDLIKMEKKNDALSFSFALLTIQTGK